METRAFPVRLGKRLETAAWYVAASSYGETTVAADVGCDHGLLSLYLVESGVCSHVYACDIRSSPLTTARRNIEAHEKRKAGTSSRITLLQTDGLSGLEGYAITHVVICGMGGEVIAGILSRAPAFRTPETRFVLQPMSRELELRSWLCENGFSIVDETLVRDAGRVYTVMDARYTGVPQAWSPSELILGKANIEKGGELLYELAVRKYGHAKNKWQGDLRRGEENDFDRRLYEELSELLHKHDTTGGTPCDDGTRS